MKRVKEVRLDGNIGERGEIVEVRGELKNEVEGISFESGRA